MHPSKILFVVLQIEKYEIRKPNSYQHPYVTCAVGEASLNNL
jgi:hypothetical protein